MNNYEHGLLYFDRGLYVTAMRIQSKKGSHMLKTACQSQDRGASPRQFVILISILYRKTSVSLYKDHLNINE
jgi:hypothetical protein